MKSADEVQDNQRQKRDLHHAAAAADRSEKPRIDRLQHEGPVESGERGERHARDRGEQDQGRVVKRQHAAEKHMQKIDIRAAQGDDGDAQRKRDQIECRKRGILAQDRRACDNPRANRDDRGPPISPPMVIGPSDRPAAR